jgi:hypothetical protein
MLVENVKPNGYRAPSGNVIKLRSLATEWLPVYRNNINSRDRLRRSHLNNQEAPMEPNTLFTMFYKQDAPNGA